MLIWINSHGDRSEIQKCRYDPSVDAPVSTKTEHGDSFVAARIGVQGCTEYLGPTAFIQTDNYVNSETYGVNHAYVWSGAPLPCGVYHIQPFLWIEGSVHLYSIQTENNLFTSDSNRQCFAGFKIETNIQVYQGPTFCVANSETVKNELVRPNNWETIEYSYPKLLEGVNFRYDGNSELQIYVSIVITVYSKGALNRAHCQARDNKKGLFRIEIRNMDIQSG